MLFFPVFYIDAWAVYNFMYRGTGNIRMVLTVDLLFVSSFADVNGAENFDMMESGIELYDEMNFIQ